MKVRVTTRRTNYLRGGLLFNDQTAVRTMAGLSIVIDEARARQLGEANIRDLVTDRSVTVELVTDDPFSGVEQRSYCLAHNQDVGGSNPPPAPISPELADAQPVGARPVVPVRARSTPRKAKGK